MDQSKVITGSKNDYLSRGCEISAEEIFVSDGSKCDSSNILDILGKQNKIAVTDPVYPVYVDTNVMTGRTGEVNESGEYEGLSYIQLASWVQYAKKNNSLILFDAAYEAFIKDDSIPHSIYEIDGAKDCAIEFRSFSKNAGFTGIRCAFTVIPKSLKGKAGSEDVELWSLWQSQIKRLVSFYMDNAQIIKSSLTSAGFEVFGALNAPYAWIKTPKNMSSWDFFDFLLENANVVGTPGSGFGAAGEGYFRLSAFNSRENVEKAMQRIVKT